MNRRGTIEGRYTRHCGAGCVGPCYEGPGGDWHVMDLGAPQVLPSWSAATSYMDSPSIHDRRDRLLRERRRVAE